MAKENGFEYELVKYKWSMWLHHHTENDKRFGDTKTLSRCFVPLECQENHFRDADQVVRADIRELASLNRKEYKIKKAPF